MNTTSPQLPHDIRGLLPFHRPWWEYALWVLAALALVAAAIYLWRYLRSRRKTAAATPVDPWDALRQRLKALQPQTPFVGKPAEEYFYQLSLLIREAIELRTRIRATDLTCQELKDPLRRKLPLPTGEIEALLTFLERADLVKFAAAPTTTDEATDSATQVSTWLERLVPRDAGVDLLASSQTNPWQQGEPRDAVR